jgi:hypothetical protein
MISLPMVIERNGVEFKHGVISLISNPKEKIVFTYDVISNNIHSHKPSSISENEMVYLGKIIHRQVGGWKKFSHYRYTKDKG